MKKSLTFSALVIGALIGASALSVWAQTSGTWTAPTATPPGNNIAAPINVSTAPQSKSGLLGLSNFLFNPVGTSGSVATGSVLTAMDSDGTVGWAPITSAVAPYMNVVLCNGSGSGWACASKVGANREIVAENQSNQNVLDTGVARANATLACSMNGYSYVGYTYYTEGTNCGEWYNGVTSNGAGGFVWTSEHCGAPVKIIDSIYCKQIPITLPAGLLN